MPGWPRVVAVERVNVELGAIEHDQSVSLGDLIDEDSILVPSERWIAVLEGG
jgi:hypothetical protein